ncbi:hypothetical protein H2248_007930 [Termitomyces sp. 'cryptogamus']|nr:hypothetical protein H2248_007930 [Termitomyces sp. 'cryptogamus']
MTPEEREIVTALGSVILGTFREQSIIVLLYGIFIPLGVLCVHDFVRKPAHRKTACIMLFGALFATCLLIVETGQVVLYLRLGMIDNTATPLTDKRETTDIVIQPWSKAVSACQLVPVRILNSEHACVTLLGSYLPTIPSSSGEPGLFLQEGVGHSISLVFSG